MPEQILRDRLNRIIGKIKTLSDGRLEIRDPLSRIRGTYNPKTNETREHLNRIVGKGNLLTTLL